MDRPLRDELQSILLEAGRVALSWFGRVSPEAKADGTPVTEADRAVEEVIARGLGAAFPGESVRSEEGLRVDGAPGSPCWYVDPIDGTGAFVSQLAYWGPTVCRVVDGALQAGAFYVPRLGELWFAEAGGGAWRDGRRLGPPPAADGIGPNDILFVPSRFHRRQPVPWPGKVRALGSSAAHLAHVAAGGGLAAFVPKWNLWDVGCGALLLQETGRVICSADGEGVRPERVTPGLPLLAGAPGALRVLIDEWSRARGAGGQGQDRLV